jgi:hypothetical protein
MTSSEEFPSSGIPNSTLFWKVTPLGTSGTTSTRTSVEARLPAEKVMVASPTPSAVRLPNWSEVATPAFELVLEMLTPSTWFRKSSKTFRKRARL